jgi:hypothetical protein
MAANSVTVKSTVVPGLQRIAEASLPAKAWIVATAVVTFSWTKDTTGAIASVVQLSFFMYSIDGEKRKNWDYENHEWCLSLTKWSYRGIEIILEAVKASSNTQSNINISINGNTPRPLSVSASKGVNRRSVDGRATIGTRVGHSGNSSAECESSNSRQESEGAHLRRNVVVWKKRVIKLCVGKSWEDS